ncbi:MAG: hypothetical protein ACLUI3_16680 [Christensenellales bacterium]
MRRSFSPRRSAASGAEIEAAKLFEYIDSGVIDAVALESARPTRT